MCMLKEPSVGRVEEQDKDLGVRRVYLGLGERREFSERLVR